MHPLHPQAGESMSHPPPVIPFAGGFHFQVFVPIEPARHFPQTIPQRHGRTQREHTIPPDEESAKGKLHAVFRACQQKSRLVHEARLSYSELPHEECVPPFVQVLQSPAQLILSPEKHLVPAYVSGA